MASTTLLQALLLASTGFFSVGAILLAIVLLLSKGGWKNGLAYAVGYTFTYLLVGGGVLLIEGQRPATQQGPSFWGSLLLWGMAALMFWFSWRGLRQPIRQQGPGWLQRLDQLTPRQSLAFGALVVISNVKNLALFLSAVSVLLVTELPLVQQLLFLLPLTLTFCLSVLAPGLLYWLFPQRAQPWLQHARSFLATHQRPINIWLPFFFGLFFLVRGWQAWP